MSIERNRVYADLAANAITNQTKIKIMETSIDLFSRRGYSGVSIRDITKEVGIKESSLYKHFKNKDELIETIFWNFRQSCSEILPPMEKVDQIAMEMDLKSFLEQGWLNFKRHIDDSIHQKMWRIVYLELFRHAKAAEIYSGDIVAKTVECLAIVFAKMAEAGKLKAMDPKLLAVEYQYPLFMMVMDYILLRSQGQTTDGVELHVANHIQYFVNASGAKQ
ncbi:TetR/AcrR family transcriptional regulator [Paenibacillus sp. CAU 1782]